MCGTPRNVFGSSCVGAGACASAARTGLLMASPGRVWLMRVIVAQVVGAVRDLEGCIREEWERLLALNAAGATSAAASDSFGTVPPPPARSAPRARTYTPAAMVCAAAAAARRDLEQAAMALIDGRIASARRATEGALVGTPSSNGESTSVVSHQDVRR